MTRQAITAVLKMITTYSLFSPSNSPCTLLSFDFTQKLNFAIVNKWLSLIVAALLYFLGGNKRTRLDWICILWSDVIIWVSSLYMYFATCCSCLDKSWKVSKSCLHIISHQWTRKEISGRCQIVFIFVKKKLIHFKQFANVSLFSKSQKDTSLFREVL